MTDDCDALIFGAHTVIKNVGAALSGNKNNVALNLAEKTDNLHTMVYRAADVENNPDTALTRGGLILFALLSGGDYIKGVENIGPKLAHGLARCGFGDQLLQAFQRCSIHELQAFLVQWRARINQELKGNEFGFLPHRSSVSLPSDFPSLEVLRKYANPLITGTERVASAALRDTANLDLAQVARLCEEFFEWGYPAMILKRFRNFMWNGAVMHVLRRAALEVDEKEQRKHTNPGPNYETPQSLDGAIGTPASIVQKYLSISKHAKRITGAFENRGPSQAQTSTPDRYPLIIQVVGSRQHASTDGILEYRAEISPVQLVEITKSGIVGKRTEPPRTEGSNAPKELTDPNTSLGLWIPATMLFRVHLVLVEQFLDRRGKKKWNGKSRALPDDFLDEPNDLAEEEDNTIASPSTRFERLCDQILNASMVPRKQKKLSGNKKAHRSDGSIPLTPKFNTPIVSDSWFNASVPRGPDSGPRDCFLFTLRDPANDISAHESEGVVEEEENNTIARPQTHFEHLCDKILGTAMYPREEKLVNSKKARSSNSKQGPSNKRRKIFSDILDLTL